MMTTTLAMRSPFSALLLALLACCTSPSLGTADPDPEQDPPPPPPTDSKPVPDHFNGSTALMTRGLTHPCGLVLDLFDGQMLFHTRYVYDPAGRPLHDFQFDATDALVEQTDYTWDNSGHLTSTRNQQQNTVSLSTTHYDTLGEAVEILTTVDNDITDAQQTPDSRRTIDFADFDGLGHAASSTELDEDLDAQTSQTRTTTYSYDTLGRSTGLEVRDASDTVQTIEQISYDDVAHTSAWYLHVTPDPAPGLSGSFRGSAVYDRAGRVLSTHLDNLDANGNSVSTNDTVTNWDGDRERSEVTTLGIGSDSSVHLHITRTFQYQCDGTPTASASQRTGKMPALPALVRFALSPPR
jgi:YD repeat-containing protein